MIRKYIDKIIEKGTYEDMNRLGNMLVEIIYEYKENQPETYKKYKDELYCMAYGPIISDETREEIVNKIGEHWTLEDTESVRNQYGLVNIKPNEFNVVMNMAYSDYKNVFGDELDTYVKYSAAFIQDSDAVEGKVYYYFDKIVKK